jgi:hypothetical protein
MIKKNPVHQGMAWALSLAAILLLAGCATQQTTYTVGETTEGQTAKAAAAAPAGIVLEYKMPEGRTLSYQDDTNTTEAQDIMGQLMESYTTSKSAFTYKAKGRKDQDFLLGVTIDDMSMSVAGPQGDMSPDLSPVVGKSFDMVLSPLGSEVDVSQAKAITYEFATGERNLASTFKLFFPDLPDKPLEIGDSWPSSYGTDEQAGTLNLRIDFQLVNTLEGVETVDGLECARIKSDITGTISGAGSQMGMEIDFSGTIKGTDHWYFAIKEGMYVRSTVDMTTEMSINVSTAGMTIPSTSTRKSEIKLTDWK